MSNFEFAVPCLFGLEGIAGDELRRLDIENVRVENGRVLFSGDARAMAKANICLRTGERVLIVLADFKATTFEQLFQGVYNTNLEDFIPKDGQFPVKGHALNSQLMSVPTARPSSRRPLPSVWARSTAFPGCLRPAPSTSCSSPS